MPLEVGSEEPQLMESNSTSWLKTLWHRLTVRFLLILGVLLFLTAVGFDSLQQASAADLSAQRLGANPALSASVLSAPAPRSAARSTAPQKSYLDFDPAIANRLGHSDLTGASLTRSRLTSSHLFTSSF